MSIGSLTCPLCTASNTLLFWQDVKREYFRCQVCQLVFVPKSFWLSEVEEKKQYDLHENNPGDDGYRAFLNRLAKPLLKYLAPASTGLDFGCGPGPTLSLLLQEHGHHVAVFDKFYFAEQSLLDADYDFITATEVAEHLHQPMSTLEQLWSKLRSGGVLALMTKRVESLEKFSSWHYKNDPTHIIFFHEATFQWLADRFDASLVFVDKDVVFLMKHC